MSSILKRVFFYPYSWRFLILNKIRKWSCGYSRPHYYHCIQEAAELAAGLSIPRISILEFGVAGGNGLVEIERICRRMSTKYKIEFEIYGFDTGGGLPRPVDYRDLPYQWQEGFFDMDRAALEKRLSASTLVIGNVKDTVPKFFSMYNPAPIGCIMFDLDYYSSTKDAFAIFEHGEAGHYLPRVQCYFDDVATIESVGVRLAIREFNDEQNGKKIEHSIDKTFHPNRDLAGWRIYEYHDFFHPQYCTPLKKDDQLPLRA